MLRFKKLIIQNFGPYKKATINFLNLGLVLVVGELLDEEAADSNGAGKTMAFEALSELLFAKTTKGASPDDLIREGSKNGYKLVGFMELDGRKLKVRRTRKHSKLGTSLKVWLDGKPEEKATVSDTTKYLSKLIGYTFDTFLNSIYFPQEGGNFFSNVTDRKRKELLEQLLGLEAFGNAVKLAREDKKIFSAQLQEVNNGLVLKRTQLDESEETQERLIKMDEEWKQDQKSKTLTLNRTIKMKQDIIKQAKERILVLKSEKPKLGTKKLQKKLDGKEIQIEDFRRAHEKTNIAKGILETEIEKLEKLLDRRVPAGEVCPTCGTLVTEKTSKKVCSELNKKLTESKERLKKAKEDCKTSFQKLEERKQEIESLRDKIRSKQNLRDKFQKSKEEIVRLEGVIETAEERIDACSKALAETETESPYEKLLKNQKKKETELRTEIAGLTKQETKFKKKLFRAEFWEDGFGDQGLKNILLESSLTYLEEQITEILNKVTKGNLSVKVKGKKKLKTKQKGKVPVRKKIDFIVERNGKRRSYFQLSGGQKKRINIASLLALRRLSFLGSGQPTNIIILDEPFTNLDSSGVDLTLELLQQEDAESKLLSSHKPLNKSGFDTIWNVKMKDEIARLEIQ